ncbi:MAG: 16S rRNA processing protein RimM [Polyangiaceae bacterium]|nr:16S rRNA processing protein RimM [Polyangiaceae bacterium]
MSIDRRLVAIAEITRPHGVRGELRLKLYNPDTSVIAKGVRVILRDATDDPKSERTVRIVGVREAQGLLIQLERVADRDAAEALRGTRILVPREELPALEDGEFYAADIEGARAELVTGELVGTVKSLTTYPTCEVLVIETPDGKTLELPLVDDVVAEVDAARRVVRLKSTEGM